MTRQETTKHETESLLMKLSSKWCLYDHAKSSSDDYDDCTRFAGSFDNVHDFWYLFNNFPKPSYLFYQKQNGKPYYIDSSSGQNKKREIASISLFREGIQPKWEDPQNINGGDITLKRFWNKFDKNTMSTIEYLDSLWLKIILNTIGSQFTNGQNITGLRVVDSSKPDKPMYRIEVWYSDLVVAETIEVEMKNFLRLSLDEKLTFRTHKEL